MVSVTEQLLKAVIPAPAAGQSHEYWKHHFLPLYVPQGRYPLGQGRPGGGWGRKMAYPVPCSGQFYPIPTPALPLKGREWHFMRLP